MSTSFATGRIAWGMCDRCGQRQQLRSLRDQVVDQKATGLMVCKECLDVDHPQLRLGKTPVFDPQALRNPRPDKRTDVVPNKIFVGYTSAGWPLYAWTADAALAGTGDTTASST